MYPPKGETMGCIKFLLSIGAFWLFSTVGWIHLSPSWPLWLTVLVVSILVIFIDLVVNLVQFLVSLVALPLILLTGGLLGYVIGGVAKYFSLAIAAGITGLFTLPWIFGEYWWQALIIGVVFAIIGGNTSTFQLTGSVTTRRTRRLRRS